MKTRDSFFKMTLIIAAVAMMVLVTTQIVIGQDWYDGNWHYRKPVSISNPGATDLSDFQVQINLTSSSFDYNKAKTDGSDILVTGSNGMTIIPYWIETWNDVDHKSSIWIKLASLPTSGATVFLYYGNPAPVVTLPPVEVPPIGPFTRATGNPIVPIGDPLGDGSSLIAENMVWDNATGHYWLVFASYRSGSSVGLAWSDDPGNASAWHWQGIMISEANAPHILYENSTWYIFYADRAAGRWGRISVATSSSITGPYTYAGTVLTQTPSSWESYRVDEPYVFKRNDGKWILVYMAETGLTDEQVGYATADDLMGPYTKYSGNPCLAFGPPGSFDAGTIADPWVVEFYGTYYIGYTVSPTSSSPWQTACATTTDWQSFTKIGIILPLGSGLDAANSFRGAVTRFGDTYYFPYGCDSYKMAMATQPATMSSTVNDPEAVFNFYDGFSGSGSPVLQGSWQRVVVDNNLDGAHNLVSEDVDNDGKLDLVADGFRANSVVWYKQPVDPINGTWTKYTVDTELTNAHDFQIGDIDGDGRKDIVGLSLSADWENYNLGNGSLVWYKKPENPLGNGSANGWTPKTSLPYNEADGSAAVFNNELYVFGGHYLGGTDPRNDVYKYNPLTDSWSALADMPTARWGHIAVEFNGLIHVFAGNNGSAATGIHEIYNPTTDTWVSSSSGNPLTIPHYGASGVVHPDVIYFPTGMDGYEYWMVYTPYPPASLENHCILRSHDGISWTAAGISNPVISGPGPTGSWNAMSNMDPDFMYVSNLNTWFMVWGGQDGSGAERIGLAYSLDGKNWTPYDGATVNGNSNPVILGSDDNTGQSWETGGSGMSKLQCPTLFYDNGTIYLFYVEDGSGLNRGKSGFATFTWNTATHSIVNLVRNTGNPNLNLPTDLVFQSGCGHINISKHPSGLYYMHAARQLLSSSSFALDLLTSTDLITWTSQGKVLEPGAAGQWDQTHIYRSCPVVDNTGKIVLSNGGFRLYYSAYSGSTPQIGIADFPESGPPVRFQGSGPANLPANIADQGLMGIKYGDKIHLFYKQYHYEYDPTTDTYTSMANVPTPRTWGTCALVNGKIYIIGGYSYGSPTGATNVNEAYDPSTLTWNSVALTPMPVSKYGATRENPVIGEKIYVTHGLDGGFRTDNYVYTPSTDSWENRGSGMNPRDGIGCGVINNKLYVVGGRGDYLNGGTGTNFFEEYEPASDLQLWTKTTIKSSGNPGLLGSRSCGLGDIDLDGDIDIAVAVDAQTYATKGRLYWYKNPGGTDALNPALWQEFLIDNTAGCGADAQIVDIDKDGRPDIVYGGNTGSPANTFIYFAPADPTNILGWTRVAVAGNAYHVYPVDYDEDGDLDLIRASAGSALVSWLENPHPLDPRNPANWNEYIIEQNSGIGSTNRAMTADIDGDGDLDIGMDADPSRSTGVFKWYRRPSDPKNVSAYQIYTIDINPTYTAWSHDAYLTDLNGDGRVDMVGVGANSNCVLWWVNDPGVAISSLDQSKWTFASGSSNQVEVSGGQVTLTAASGAPVRINGTTSFGMDYLTEIRGRHPQNGILNEIMECGFIGNDFNYCARFVNDFPDVSHWERITTNGAGNIGNVISMATPSDANWHTFRVYRQSPNASIFQVDNNPSEIDASNTSTTTNLYPFLMSYTTSSPSQFIVDWARVRKWAGGDPLTLIGSEQSQDLPAPTGDASQTFCSGATVNNLVATGSNIQWYAAATGGFPLASSVVLVNGNHYYASQTVNGTESMARLDVTVTINQTPIVIINTPAPVCAPNTVDLTAGAITEGSTTGLTFSYWMNAEVTIPCETPATAGAGIYYIKGTTAAGCYDIKPVTVTVNSASTISGYLTYYNSANTPIGNVTFNLKQGDDILYTTTSNSSGGYTFNNVYPGTYDIVLDTDEPVDGINATDAAQVNYWGTEGLSYQIEMVRFLAGDVTGDNQILAADASRILQYFVTGGTQGWENRDSWTFWKTGDLISNNPGTEGYPAITVPCSNVTQNFFGLVTGDFNRNYVPGSLKAVNESLTLIYGETINVIPDMEFNLPLSVVSEMEVGAVSLILEFPSDLLEVTGVYLSDDPNASLMHSISGDELRIGWNSLDPISLLEGESLLTLKVKVIGLPGEEGIRFKLATDPLNELADGNYNVIDNAVLSIDVITTSMTGTGEISLSDRLTLTNHPNPFTGKTTFTYSLPVDGQVTLEVFDIVGNKVISLVNEIQSVGDYFLSLDAVSLQPGVYTATLKLKNGDTLLTRTIKMISKK